MRRSRRKGQLRLTSSMRAGSISAMRTSSRSVEAAATTWLGKLVFSVLRETGVEASIPFLSDRLLEKGCDSYISQYKNLKWDFQYDDAVKGTLARVSTQVEHVFGRPLAQR